MIKKGHYRCLMVKTKDNHTFFTHQRYYPQLVQFSNIFGAEISVVTAKNADVLDLIELAPAICTKSYSPRPEIEILETKITIQRRKRIKLLKHSKHIRQHIEDQLRNGDPVSLKTLNKRFSRYHVTSACLCNHLRIVREQLQKDGLNIQKIGNGVYQLVVSDLAKVLPLSNQVIISDPNDPPIA